MAIEATPIPIISFTDSNGNTLSGGTIETYEAGTTTGTATWADADKSTSNGNSVTLDVNGTAMIFGDNTYKFIVKDSDGNVEYTWDDLDFNYGSDSYIDDEDWVAPAEKKIAITQWQNTQAEYIDIGSRATEVSVTYATYTTKYTALETYLTTTISDFIDITVNTELVAVSPNTKRDSYDLVWEEYFEAKENLLNAIQTKIIALYTAQQALCVLLDGTRDMTDDLTISRPSANSAVILEDSATGAYVKWLHYAATTQGSMAFYSSLPVGSAYLEMRGYQIGSLGDGVAKR